MSCPMSWDANVGGGGQQLAAQQAGRGMKRNVNHNWHQVQGWLEGASGDCVMDFLQIK